MAETTNALTMDEIITGLGDIRAAIEGKGQEICQAAVNILFAFTEEGAQTAEDAEDAMDILHDYRLQAKQGAALRQKHAVAGKTFLKDGVWHCPDCNRRVSPNHSFCHRCGKKLRWR